MQRPKTNLSNLCVMAILAIILLLTLTSGCVLSSYPGTYWVVNEYGTFQTNDLNRAQQEIPFTIVLPTYLPDNLDSHYPNRITGPTKGSGGHDVSIDIDYYGSGRIYISEENSLKIMGPNQDTKPNYLQIAGIQVLQQEGESYSAAGTTKGLRFDWNRGQFTYSLSIYSYSQDEAIKIVESMVKQP